MIILKHNSNLRRAVLILLALIMTSATAWAQFGGGDGSQSNPYLINNETHWNNLGADIGTSSNPVNTMAGSEGHEFCGTFDGNGKTIHISLNSTGNYTAIFRCVSNVGSNSATIKNLNVEGTVTANAGHKYAGGLVGGCWGVITIENCRVSTVINSFVVGDGTHGGIFLSNQPMGGGLFGYGSSPDGQTRGWSDDGFLFFPGHASYGNWNSDPDGWTDYPPDPEVPLGGGALLLIGFGATYAVKKRKKTD